MPMMVVADQYRPRPAGTTITNHANSAGIIHCIIWFICFCWSLAAIERPVEMRCWSHMEAKTTATSSRFPLALRSMNRNLVLRGAAFSMSSMS